MSVSPTDEALTGHRPWQFPRTIGDGLRLTVQLMPERIAVRTLDDGVAWTWRELYERIRDLAGGLTELGVRRGDRVALLLGNRPEFHLADHAVMVLGASSFSVYTSYAPEQIRFVVTDAGASVIVTDQSFLPGVRAACTGMSREPTVVVLDGPATEGVLALDAVAASGRRVGFDIDAAIDALDPELVLTLIYTSGTTGDPKGVELTHANIIAAAAGLEGRVWWPEHARVISWLPAAHIAERMAHHWLPTMFGGQVTCCPDAKLIGGYLADVRPTWFFAVPRVWEKLKAALESSLSSSDEEGARTEAALDAALRWVRLTQVGEPVPDELALAMGEAEPRLADLRRRVGLDAARTAHVGAAPTPPEVLEFFHAIGVPVSELWGLSESAGTGTSNPPGRIKIGTVGLPAPGVELRLAEDGEILIRGKVVMRAYRNRPDLTAETVVDGWLRTGDVGHLDDDGYLVLHARKKELIINAMGQNMSPGLIESRIKAGSPLIGQACCIGDRMPYNTALIVLDPDAARAWAIRNGPPDPDIADLAADVRVREAVREGIDRANARLSRPEQIKTFTILDRDWLPAGDELTPTSKLKRRAIAEKYAETIKAMYDRPATPGRA